MHQTQGGLSFSKNQVKRERETQWKGREGDINIQFQLHFFFFTKEHQKKILRWETWP